MYKSIKTMHQALQEARAYRDPIVEDKGFSSQQIKMAYGVLNDPRYKQGNYSGAFKAIEKIAKGLASHPDVANALKRANESLDEAKDLMLTYGKPGGDAKVYYTDFMQDLQNKASEFRKKGFVIGKMGKTMPMSQLSKTMPMKGMDIKEEELEEAMKLKYDKGKEGWYDEKGRRRYLSIGATNAIMRKKLDHAIKTGDWTDFNKEEVSLDERSPTKRELDSSELINLYQIKNKDAKILDRIAELQKKLGMKNEELETGEQNDETV